MSLFSINTILDRLAANECTVSGHKLRTGEAVFAKAAVAELYDRTPWSKKSLVQLKEVITALVSGRHEIEKKWNDEPLLKSRLNLFFGNLLAQRESVPEYCLHAYIFLFWREVAYRNCFINPCGHVFFTSASLDNVSTVDSKYGKLIRRVKEAANVDLVAISEETQHIFLVEVKRGALDDRAVGQVLRYYNDVSKLLIDRLVRDFDLAYVRPVLVLGGAERRFLEAFPPHFRDLLDVLEYGEETALTDRKVVLTNIRKRYLSGYMAG